MEGICGALMLKRLSPRERFQNLVASWEPLVRKAFFDAIEEIKGGISFRKLVNELKKHSIEGALAALNFDHAAFRGLEDMIRLAYGAGGVSETEQMPPFKDDEGYRATVRFDTRNLFAEEWLATQSATLVTRIIEEQREAIRYRLSEGLMRGDNPTRTALDIVGRVNRATGRRTGGIIGLNSPQAEAVYRAGRELSSGDPKLMKKYLLRKRRDQRFDSAVRKAIREERPVPVATVSRITGRYADKLLKLRGDTIALNETFAALNEAKMEAWRQAIAKRFVQELALTKTWSDSRDSRVRHTHRAMNGQVVSFDGQFQSPSGATLRYPHDPKAPTAERVGCRCWMQVKMKRLPML